jgi:hypothetical protein
MNNCDSTDYRSAWDEVIETYFIDLIKFLPSVAARFDLELPYEFLNRDFQQMKRDSENTQEYTSKLVRVWLKQPKEEWVMIHLQVQGGYFEDLPSSMFIQSGQIFERYDKHPLSLVILCDEDQNWRPNQFSFGDEAFGSSLKFGFHNLKLLDFNNEKRWQELEASDNPFSIVIMAHLKAQTTKQAPDERKIWKTKLTHRLYEKGLEEQDIRNLYKFIDKALVLPEPLEKEFWEELKQFELEQNVTYITMKTGSD